VSEGSNPTSVTEAVKAPLGADEPDAHHGRPASWACTIVVTIGFVLGGIAMCIGPNWLLFWVGAAIVVVGGIIGAVARIFDDWY
jgi:hypothetical protein